MQYLFYTTSYFSTPIHSFETEPHIIHTIPLAREHCDSYSYYIRYKTLEIIPQNPFQIVFNPVEGINTETYYRTIHPQNITLPIQDVFISYMDKLIEHNENQDSPLYRLSYLETLKDKYEYFEVPDLETTIQRHNKTNHFNTDSFRTSHLMKIRYHKSKSFLTFS